MNQIRIFIVMLVMCVVYYTTSVNAATKSDLNQAFNVMITDPANIEATLNYANIAVSLNNYEAAIPAFERILLFNPDLDEIRLKLGVLYYKLHSYDMAKIYLEEVADTKKANKDIREKAQKYLQKM